jgi:CheY-like chemotaxis protein
VKERRLLEGERPWIVESTFASRHGQEIPQERHGLATDRRRDPTMKSILVVDDVRDIAEATAELLGMLGYETQTAFNGREAVDMTNRAHPDVVLLDLHMPVLDGLDAAREIRMAHPGQPPLLIALSAVSHLCKEGELEACGFDHSLTKPVDVETLVRLIEATN